MVVDVAKLSVGREDYYVREVAHNREEYLTGHGRTMAVLKIASGQAVPDEVVHLSVDDPRPPAPGDPGPPDPTTRRFQVPTPSGIWSDVSPLDRLRSDARP